MKKKQKHSRYQLLQYFSIYLLIFSISFCFLRKISHACRWVVMSESIKFIHGSDDVQLCWMIVGSGRITRAGCTCWRIQVSYLVLFSFPTHLTIFLWPCGMCSFNTPCWVRKKVKNWEINLHFRIQNSVTKELSTNLQLNCTLAIRMQDGCVTLTKVLCGSCRRVCESSSPCRRRSAYALQGSARQICKFYPSLGASTGGSF